MRLLPQRQHSAHSLQQTAFGRPRSPARFIPHPSALILVLTLLPCLLLAQITFLRTYGTSMQEQALAVHQTQDGGYFISGWTGDYDELVCDFFLVRTDSLGNQTWLRTYHRIYDDCNCGQPTMDGGYVMVGWSGIPESPVGGTWLVKTNGSGDTMWTRYFGDGESKAATSVWQTTEGGYVMAGGIGESPYIDFWLAKTDSVGDTLWTRRYGRPDCTEYAYSVAQTADSGYVLVGVTYEAEDVFYLVRTDARGDTLWTRTYPVGSRTQMRCVRQAADGGFIVVGHHSLGGPAVQLVLLKVDSSGTTEWSKYYPGTGWATGRWVQPTRDGGYVVCGTIWPVGSAPCAWLLKTDENGDTLWTRMFGSEDHSDYARAVTQTSDGGYALTGTTYSFGGSMGEALLVKTDSVGYVSTIAETPERRRAEPLRPTILTRAQLQAELQSDRALSLFDASGREVLDPRPGVLFLRSPGVARKVLVTD
ncbi:MAG: hypothetical protein JSU73_06155 [candidate division WOR-3 bacterium]|nr:MAG: hypothetical protein JSU73_06155 [candidate division WOR-3 bacterium]